MAQKRKRKLRRGILAFLIILLLLVLSVVGAWIWYKAALQPAGTEKEEETVEIQQGETHDQLLDQLSSRGIIKSDLAAKIYSKMHNVPYYAGNYRINKGMSTREILNYFADPANQEDTYSVVTIPEGYWAKQIAQVLSNHFPQYTPDDFLNLWNDPKYIETLAQTYDFIDPKVLEDDRFFVALEGYLFPETYYIDYDMTPDQMTRMFLDQFQKEYDAIKDQIEKSGMSLEQVLTLASIVQFESGDPKDMKDIAAVFLNRLNKGMKLQSSVTVCYALYDDFKDAQDCEVNPDIDSPYNTYLHDGLPIGPILNPGREAIEAVLNPNKNDYLYFVADIHGDGAVHYAKTYEEHLENMEKYNLIVDQDKQEESK